MFVSPGVAAILRHFPLEQLLFSQEVPQSTFPLDLSIIKGASFEPLGDASLEDLTHKTILIFGLASGRCCSKEA